MAFGAWRLPNETDRFQIPTEIHIPGRFAFPENLLPPFPGEDSYSYQRLQIAELISRRFSASPVSRLSCVESAPLCSLPRRLSRPCLPLTAQQEHRLSASRLLSVLRFLFLP
nr:hypothetical protein Iba_chr07cCG14290 [Ipomoea batatas]